MPLSTVPRYQKRLSQTAANTALHNPRMCAGLILSSAATVSNSSKLVNQSRSFFWWNYRGQDWSSYLDANFQKHMKRRHRRLMYKYTKALRRNELWERDASYNTSRPFWGWRLSSSWGKGRWVDDERLSALKSRPQDPHPTQPPKTWDEEYMARRAKAAEAFEKFKEKIDADPYGALFGRSAERLYGYTSLARPWSSLSWCFKSRPAHEKSTTATSKVKSDSAKIPIKDIPKKPSKANNSDSPVKAQVQPRQDIINSRASKINEEYEYDPISMRKVPRIQAPLEQTSVAVAPEKAVDIPVKTFAGYRARFNQEQLLDAENAERMETNSVPTRIPAFQNETDACGPDGTPARIDRPASSTRASVHSVGTHKETTDENGTISATKNTKLASSDDSLFAGTAYQSRADLRPQVADAVSKDWLEREGFGSSLTGEHLPHSTAAAKSSEGPCSPDDQRKIDSPPSPSSAPTSLSSGRQSTPFQDKTYDSAEIKTDDVDLLRASDIRASTRFALQTNNDHEAVKEEKRKELEADFAARQQQTDASPDHKKPQESSGLDTTARQFFKEFLDIGKRMKSEAITKVQGHKLLRNLVREIDANENRWKLWGKFYDLALGKLWKKGQRALMAATSLKSKTDAEKLMPNSKALASTITPKTAGMPAAKNEVLTEELASSERTVNLQRLTELAEQEQKNSDAQLQRLVHEFRDIYEETYGVLDVKHRQVKVEPTMDPALELTISKVSHALEATDALVKHATTLLNNIKKANFYRQRNLNREITAAIADANKNRNTPTMAPSKPYSPPTVMTKPPPSPPSTSSPATVQPSLYRILAYDSSTLQMSLADTTSSSTTPPGADPPLSPTEVLSRLNSPAKFLPYFRDMQDQGFEIVSGGGDMLVFKKVREVSSAMTSTTPAAAPPKPVEPKVRESDAMAEPGVTETSAEKKGRVVRREEDRFSGSNRKWQDELQEHFEEGQWDGTSGAQGGSFATAVKRVIFTGGAFAAVCYAIGAVAESFKTMERDREREKAKGRGGRPGMFSTEDSR